MFLVPCDDDTADDNPPVFEIIDEFHRICVIGDPEIGPDFLPFDISGIDTENDICMILQLIQQLHLHIGIESGKDATGMIIEKQFTTEFQVQFLIEPMHTFSYLSCLFSQVFLVVESDGMVHWISVQV